MILPFIHHAPAILPPVILHPFRSACGDGAMPKRVWLESAESLGYADALRAARTRASRRGDPLGLRLHEEAVPRSLRVVPGHSTFDVERSMFDVNLGLRLHEGNVER